jgi:hypothetical protein
MAVARRVERATASAIEMERSIETGAGLTWKASFQSSESADDEHLKTRLLHRSSRHVTLTDAGAVYIRACRSSVTSEGIMGRLR